MGNDRMLAEARRLGQLQHPSIANIYSVDSSGDFNFIVSKLMLSNLADCVSRVRPTVAESVRGCSGNCRCRHVRSLGGLGPPRQKPANVLLDRNGQVYLSDFGIAIEGQVTTGGGHTGTPAYMAPEQVAGGPVGPPADVWGLGVLLYELLARRRPFETVSEADMSECILRHQPDAPSTWYPSIPPNWIPFVLRACPKTPDCGLAGPFSSRPNCIACCRQNTGGWFRQIRVRSQDSFRGCKIGKTLMMGCFICYSDVLDVRRIVSTQP